MPQEIKLQPLKEGVEAVEVNAIKIAVGDQVAVDQPLLEVQADKAGLEVPSPAAGRVVELRVKEGDEIKIGQVYLVLDSTNGAPAAPAKPAPAAPAKPTPAAPAKAEAPKETAPKAEPRKPAEAPSPPRKVETPAPARDGVMVVAGPATRRLAREFGVDLKSVPGSGRGGRITEEDVKQYVRQVAASPVAAPVSGGV